MAEVIGIASGLLTLAGFALQSSQVLIRTLQSFQSSKKSVRDLKKELEELVAVLESVAKTCGDTDFPTLKFPVYECGEACKEFEAYINKCAPRSNQDRKSFRDWASLTMRGDSIEEFKNKIAANKSTIGIALADANLRTAIVTSELVKEYKDMVADTISDLEDRLEKIGNKLESLPLRTADSEEDKSQRKRIQEEMENTKQCLSICNQVSRHIDHIRPSIFKNISTPPNTLHDAVTTNTGPVSANFATEEALKACETTMKSTIGQLEKHLVDMTSQLQSLRSESDGTSREKEAERRRIIEEFDYTKQSLALCIEASERVTKTRLNIYQEVSLANDGNQYIVSTIGDLISAKNISAGDRSVQLIGQLSDESFQTAVTHTVRTPVKEAVDGQNARQTGFGNRYGTGFKLNKQEPTDSGAN